MKILMAERSDIYHDVRVQKEANSLMDASYEVIVFGLRDAKMNTDKSYRFKLSTCRLLPRRYKILRKLHLFLLVIFINIRVMFSRADFYHAHNTMFLFGMWIASRIFRSKLVYDSHEVQWEATFLESTLEKLFIKKADRIINVSEGRAVEQAKRYGVDKRNITIVSNYPVYVNGLNINFEIRTGRKIRFIYSGGFHLGSNRLDNFVKALIKYPEIYFDLMAFGYGSSAMDLSELIKTLNLTDRVRFIPLVAPADVIKTISNYDFAVNMLINPDNLVSFNYPSINKIYEYLAAGLPIFCSDLPSFRDEIEHNGAGVCVDSLNIGSVEKGLEKILAKSNEELTGMKRKAIELAVNQFNWSTQEKKLVKLYKELVT